MVTHSQLEGYEGEVKWNIGQMTIYGFVQEHTSGAALVKECFATSVHGKSDHSMGDEHLVSLEDLTKAPLFELAEAKQMLIEDGELRQDPSRGEQHDAEIRRASA